MHSDSEVKALFAKLTSPRALVLGDLMLDRYAWCEVNRISPEAPIPVLDVTHEESFVGGASNVAVKIVELGGSATISGVVGDDPEGSRLIELLGKAGVQTCCVKKTAVRPTTLKTRYLSKSQQVIRVDREKRDPIDESLRSQLFDCLRECVVKADVLVVSDYNKGVLTREMLSSIIAEANKAGVPVVVDPKGSDYTRYKGADLLTPNVKEAMTAAGIKEPESDDSLRRCAEKIFEQTGARYLVITRSAQGMTLYENGGAERTFPARRRDVYDVTGAGDAVAAMFAVSLGSGLNPFEAAPLSVVVAGLTVAQLGVGHVTRDDLRAALYGGIINSSDKIVSRSQLAQRVQELHLAGKKVVFTNGCFDIMHIGHIRLLERAREFGDALIVAVNTDASVSRLKGPNRPIVDEVARAAVLASLSSVDFVTLFDEDTPLELIRAVLPDVLVKGGDYSPATVVGADVVTAAGGRVEIVPLVEGFSTTDIVRKIVSTTNGRM